MPFGYQVKIEIISDVAGSTVVNTINGGYILDVGEYEKSVDGLLGEIKYPTIQFKVRNVAHFWSNTMFAPGFTSIIVKLWYSYDSGATWENDFFGFIDLKSVAENNIFKDESYTRIYTFTAKHAWLTFKDGYPDYAPGLDMFPGGTPPRSFYGDYWTRTGSYANQYIRVMTDSSTYQLQNPLYCFAGIDYALFLIDIWDFAYSTIPSYYGKWPISWMVANDYSLLQHSFKFLGSTPVTGTISDIALGMTDAAAGRYIWFNKGGTSGQRSAVGDTFEFQGDAKDWYGIAKDLTDSLFIMCDPVMSATSVITNYHKCRLMDSSAAAITGALPSPFSVSKDHANWITGVSVSTRGMHSTTEAGQTGAKGQQIAYATKLMTVTAQGLGAVDRWTNLQHIEEDGGAVNNQPWMNQMFIYKNPGASEIIRDVNQVRLLNSQSYFPSSPSFYGLQEAIFDLIYANCPINQYNPLAAEQWKLKVKTLKGSTVQDLALMKTIPFDGKTLLITGLKKSPMKNETEITGWKL